MAKILTVTMRLHDSDKRREEVAVSRAFDLDDLRATDLGYGIVAETAREQLRAIIKSDYFKEKPDGTV
jgi:hypothetical protein